MPKKYLFKLKNQSQNWINNIIKVTKAQYEVNFRIKLSNF